MRAFACRRVLAEMAMLPLLLTGYTAPARGQNLAPAPPGLVNVSTRLQSRAGDSSLFGGFIITGTGRKRIIIRALAPSLGIPGTIPDPIIYLLDAHGNEFDYNNGWLANERVVRPTGIAPSNDREAAIVIDLEPGSYTARVDDIGTQTGIALFEVYDLGTVDGSSSNPARLAELSTRGPVQTDDNVMIAGFIIKDETTKVIIRALGPSVPGHSFSTLQDPTLSLHDASGSVIFSNDNWRSDQEQAIKDTGVPPTDDREAAIVATLAPGNYTSIVRGVSDTTGVALVEVYDLTH